MNVKHLIKVCAVVLSVFLSLHGTTAMAGLVTTDQMSPQSQLEADKIKIQTFIEREDVKDRLQAMGVLESMSKARVAAMTSEEVHAVAQKIDSMPAGGRARDSDLVLILVLLILLLLII